MTNTPRNNTPYPCPKCGATEAWQANYYWAVHQGVTLVYGDDIDDIPEVEDYDGCENSYDDGATENEAYVCQRCDYRITLGEFRFIPEGGTST